MNCTPLTAALLLFSGHWGETMIEGKPVRRFACQLRRTMNFDLLQIIAVLTGAM
jgi:hypothetical protein